MLLRLIVEIIAAVLALAVYFLPSLIADRRKRADLIVLALFNAVLGWTVIGWALALYWAFQPNPPRELAGDIVRSRKANRMRAFSAALGRHVQTRERRHEAGLRTRAAAADQQHPEGS